MFVSTLKACSSISPKQKTISDPSNLFLTGSKTTFSHLCGILENMNFTGNCDFNGKLLLGGAERKGERLQNFQSYVIRTLMVFKHLPFDLLFKNDECLS